MSHIKDGTAEALLLVLSQRSQARVPERSACGGQYNSKAPNRVLVIQDSTDPRAANVFRALCDNMINALKLLVNQQKDGDSLVKMVVQGLQERSLLRTTDGLRSFIIVGNHEAGSRGKW